MTANELRDIPGWEGLYAVTADGRIWSHPKAVPVGRNGGVRTQPGRWLTPTRPVRTGRHTRVYLARGGRKTPMLTHQAVALAWLPNPHGHRMLNHLDGDGGNNDVSNLEWCTARRNAQHAYGAGLVRTPNVQGARNPAARLTVEKVREIRARAGENLSALAREYGVSPRTVNDVVHRRTWVDV